MIQLTKIHGEMIFINAQSILWVEEIPDTTITFVNGVKMIVQEKGEEIRIKMQNIFMVDL
jgi:flagellar protein FlbD